VIQLRTTRPVTDKDSFLSDRRHCTYRGIEVIRPNLRRWSGADFHGSITRGIVAGDLTLVTSKRYNCHYIVMAIEGQLQKKAQIAAVIM